MSQQQDVNAESLPSSAPPPAVVRNAPRQFNVAFGLMSVIPLLISCYLITVRFFSIEILLGVNGTYILLAAVFSILGFMLGHRIISGTIQALIQANGKSEGLVRELADVNRQLQDELEQRKQIEAALKAEKAALETMNKVMMDREGRIVELKREVNLLLEAGQQPKRYDV